MSCVAGGCGVNGPPGLWERRWIESHEKAMVLIRLTAEQEDQQFVPGVKLLQLGILDFDTGGEERPIEFALGRGLDAGSARQGWYFMLLEPGTHYVVAGTTRILGQRAPRNDFNPDEDNRVTAVRLRIDVPPSAAAVYAGSIHMSVRTRRLLLGRACTSIDDASVTIIDQSEAAAALVGERAAWAGPPQTSIMQRHRGRTLQFRTATGSPGPGAITLVPSPVRGPEHARTRFKVCENPTGRGLAGLSLARWTSSLPSPALPARCTPSASSRAWWPPG